MLCQGRVLVARSRVKSAAGAKARVLRCPRRRGRLNDNHRSRKHGVFPTDHSYRLRRRTARGPCSEPSMVSRYSKIMIAPIDLERTLLIPDFRRQIEYLRQDAEGDVGETYKG